MRLTLSCLLITLTCLFALEARANGGEIYKYVDERGVCHFTNAPTDKRYKPANLNPPARQILILSDSPAVYRTNRRTLRLSRQPVRSGKTYSSNEFDYHIRHAARIHNVDPMLIKAIIKTESNFNRYAVSSVGAQGLMQLMPATAKYLRVGDPFDPWQNIYGGTRYIKKMLDSFHGDLRLSLAAYNAGPTRVLKYRAIPRIPETINYVRKVMQQYQAYQRTYSPPLKTSIRVRQLVMVN